MTTDTKKKAKWTLVSEYAVWTGVSKLVVKFDLTMLFPDFMELTTVQQMTVYYGVKQKLADSIAGIGKDATDTMRSEDMVLTYERLTDPEDPRWNAEKSVGVKLMTKPQFMDQCERDGVPTELAEKLWTMARSKQTD